MSNDGWRNYGDGLVRVLDEGYVQLVECYGSDERIIEAARMSTQKGFLGWGSLGACTKCGLPKEDSPPFCADGLSTEHNFERKPGDEKLLRYLYENKHATPFEMAGAIFEVQAPIFVFREWHRHRTQSYNEMSARYAPLPDLNYVPSVARVERGPGHPTRQAGGVVERPAEDYPHQNADRFRKALQGEYAECERVYQASLASGVPKELARLVLPVGRYSRMRASANLRNWLAFLTLRMDIRAQWEIQQYAQAVSFLLAERFPRTHALFAEELDL